LNVVHVVLPVHVENVNVGSTGHVAPDFVSGASTSQISEPNSRGDDSLLGHHFLHDIFLSHRVVGVRASIFHLSKEYLLRLCELHGLDVNDARSSRDIKRRLLYHLLNGDCLRPQCVSKSPAPDKTACLCIARGFSLPLAVTSFIVSCLKNTMPSAVAIEDLLLIVESIGTQSPYENRLCLRRQILKSLDTFVHVNKL